ncbi:uncharacterized protein LOC134195618 isoform X2 [Corticium candelabrum]|uniref:uncharacterized protein LOC134195618 isoform X2 n=1 Tax=Corticium candelabrum TaxID=121492 RepID=UPI002E2620FD|nr:uncharacterized protein LOC134195618 isoform X2 [Corticium candelabrum]
MNSSSYLQKDSDSVHKLIHARGDKKGCTRLHCKSHNKHHLSISHQLAHGCCSTMRKLYFLCFATVLLCQALGGERLFHRWYFNSGWQKLEADGHGNYVNCRQKENTYAEQDYCDCDSISSLVMINPWKTYEFSIDIHASQKHMRNYFGFYVYDSNKDKIEGSWNRPYFENSDDHYHLWQKWRAYIFSRDTPDTDNDGQSDPQNHMTNGKDWVWPTNASYVALRFGSCYYGTGRLVLNRKRRHPIESVGVTWFRYPTVREIEQPLSILFSDRRHPNMRMFKTKYSRDWSTMPKYGGMAFVNGKHTRIARVTEQGQQCYYPWGITRQFTIDPNSTYEFSIWLLSTGKDLHNFLGFQVYDVAFNILNVGGLDKPYIKRTNNDTKIWTRWNGFVLPATTDPSNIPKHYSNGVSWQLPPNSKYAQLRFGTCYGNGDNAGKSYFAYPQVVDFDLDP